MTKGWATTILSSVEGAAKLLGELNRKGWICRGQSGCYGKIVPTIDRGTLCGLSRAEKLDEERKSIQLFRATALFFSDEGERIAFDHDIGALMVLRHYGVPTRLVDWTRSAYVAAYFASHDTLHRNGEIWAFDYERYLEEGEKQWKRWPHMTTDGSGKGEFFDRLLPTAFAVRQPPPWFVCYFYNKPGFHRQRVQSGLWSVTGRFELDHADAVAALLKEPACFHRYIIRANIKAKLCGLLRRRHDIWRGSLFPDSAGAAETAKLAFA